MKKLIMTIIMVIMGTITIAEENHPDNWMIWDRSYATFTVKYSDTVSGRTGDATFFYYQK